MVDSPPPFEVPEGLAVVSMVGIRRTNRRFPLDRLARRFGWRYEPEMMAFAMAQSVELGKVMLYASGTMIFAGHKSVERLLLANDELTASLRSAGIDLPEGIPDICNIVAQGRLSRSVELEQLSRAHVNIEYEPEVFPGAFFRPKDTRVLIVIFASGKFTITGARSSADLLFGQQEVVALVG